MLHDYEAARGFLQGLPGAARIAISYHGDADGTAAAALAVHFLRDRGHPLLAIAPGKGEDLYTGPYLERLRGYQPDALVVLDQGSRPRAVLPETRTLVIDHHDAPPQGVPVEVYLSGLHEEPVPSTSVMVWRLLSGIDALDDRLWLAAVGALGDYGAAATFPEVQEAKHRCGARNLTEVVALVNAAKRAAAHDTELSLAALLEAETPADLAHGRIAHTGRLTEYRKEVQGERARCAKTAPAFSGDWVLLRFASPCQVHGPVASAWIGRLPEHIVMAANEGYTPDNVHFSVRTRRPGENLLERLRTFREATGVTDLGQGHAQATGGIVRREQFNRLLAALGFASEQEPRRAA